MCVCVPSQVSHLTKLRKNRREKEVRFPLDRKLRSGPEEHFNIIIEQARKLIDGRTNERLCGLQFWDGDEEFSELLERMKAKHPVG